MEIYSRTHKSARGVEEQVRMSTESPVGTGETFSGEVVRFVVEDHGGDAKVLRVLGEIDTVTAPVLRERIGQHLPQVALLVLDLSSVTFLGSAGLAVLVAAKEDAERHGHRLRLVCGSRTVTRALEATGLLGLFDVADGVPAALRPGG